MTVPEPTAEPVIRRAARVLVIDHLQRLLVLGVRDRIDGHVGWFMPGGGIEKGETAEQTARRELLEELGLDEDPVLRGPLWQSHYTFTWNGRRVIQDEWFFLLRLDPGTDQAAMPLAHAAGTTFEARRWLPLAELARVERLIGPPELLSRLRDLLAGEASDRSAGPA